MKRIRLYIAAITLLLGLGGLTLAPEVAMAAASSPKTVVCTTLQSGTDCSSTPPGSVSVNSVITVVITILSEVVGVVAVIMLIVGGFKYVTSNGDSNKISSAKNTIIYALVGVVIAVLAQAIVQFVLAKATGQK